jgi:alpha-D-ribose 1-methylphosphonate 5-triphosphate synthase subunit PhnG
MLHVFDSPTAAPALQRPDWMALLARAPQPLLEAGLGAAGWGAQAQAEPYWLRRPETGLLMVQGRAGGNGERFNLGEVTVTRCALRLQLAGFESAVGIAYVLGRQRQRARLAAVADALLQDPAHQAALQQHLLAPVQQHLQALRDQRRAQAQTTKVEFFTLAREAGVPDDVEDGV